MRMRKMMVNNIILGVDLQWHLPRRLVQVAAIVVMKGVMMMVVVVPPAGALV